MNFKTTKRAGVKTDVVKCLHCDKEIFKEFKNDHLVECPKYKKNQWFCRKCGKEIKSADDFAKGFAYFGCCKECAGQ